MMEEKYDQSLDFELLAKIVIGIGEVSEITEVPQRQIRYWEEKGVIKSVSSKGAIRRYDFSTIKKILLVKELMDEGFTLEKAVEKVNIRLSAINKAFSKISVGNKKAIRK
jgi:predicted transcriptional regulator